MSHYRFFVVLLAAFVLAATGAAEAAQAPGASAASPWERSLSLSAPLPAEELPQGYGKEIFIYHDPQLSFGLLLPDGWERTPYSTSKEIVEGWHKRDRTELIPLGHLSYAPRRDAGLQVFYMRLPAKVALSEFMTMAIQGKGEVLARSGAQLAAKASEQALIRSEGSLGRCVAFRRGEIVFFLVASAAQGVFAERNKAFGMAFSNFATMSEKARK